MPMTRLEEQHYDHNKRVGQHAPEGDRNMPDAVRGAVSGFAKDGTSFFRPYVAGFIARKLELSGIGPDDGTRKFLAEPVCAILRNAENPAAVLEDIIADVPRADRQKVLNLVLQSAHTPELAEVIMTAGGDPNAFHGAAVANALQSEIDKDPADRDLGLLTAFNKHGGNLRLANESYELDIRPDCLQRMQSLLTHKASKL